jgi:hypothetical protein
MTYLERQEFEKERTCTTCGKTYSLKQLAEEASTPEAADRIKRTCITAVKGIYDPHLSYFILDKCSTCSTEHVKNIIADAVKKQIQTQIATPRKNSLHGLIWPIIIGIGLLVLYYLCK